MYKLSTKVLKSITINIIILLVIFPFYKVNAYPGELDTSFTTITGVAGQVHTIKIQSDQKIVIAGGFTDYDGTSRYHIARLNVNGSLDTSFNPGSGANNEIRGLIIKDNKFIIAGNFTSYNGTSINRIARLNSDGSLDTSFNVGTGVDGIIYTAEIDSNGKILIAGNFTSYNGTPINRIARLNSDGSLDTSFNVGTGVDLEIFSSAIETNGKILIGGNFTSYNGTPINRIARLNSDGSLDTSFNVGTGASDVIRVTKNVINDKVLIAGDFTSYNGTSINRIARLNSDGSLDTSFNVGTGVDASIYTAEIDSNDKILIGGDFTDYNGSSVSYVTRLLDSGDIDGDFSGTASTTVSAIKAQDDTRVILAGLFHNYNGSVVNRIIRVLDLNPVLSLLSSTPQPIPTYTFNTTIGGTVTYGGSCVNGSLTTAVAGRNTVAFNGLIPNTYSNCTIIVNNGTPSTPLTIPTFTVDAPGAVSISALTPVINPINIISPTKNETPATQEKIAIEVSQNSGTKTVTDYPASSTPGTTYISPIDNKENSCPGFQEYLKKGDRGENVKLLQAFLNKVLDKNIKITGIFGPITENTVKEYQNLHKDSILTPWGLKDATGFWYKSSRFTANKNIGCVEKELTLDNGAVLK